MSRLAHPRLDGLAGWWRGRSPRERYLLLVMVVAALAYGVDAGIVRPLLSGRAAARADIARYELALARLAAAPAGAPAPVAESSGQPVTAIVTETAAAAGIPIRRIEPEGDGATVAIDAAAFADVLRWIDGLETGDGLRVTAAEMQRQPEPGVVSATLSLRR